MTPPYTLIGETIDIIDYVIGIGHLFGYVVYNIYGETLYYRQNQTLLLIAHTEFLAKMKSSNPRNRYAMSVPGLPHY